MAELYRFAAFISYSSKDAAFARRLHTALEAYRIPKSLGSFDLLGEGGKPNRVYPVFRDREELSAGDLGERIEAALRASSALIVVCTPDSAASPWVQKEIEYFSALGRRQRIFTVIPDAASSIAADDDPRVCFPPALRGGSEPLAADARKRRDGFRGALLKMVAGLIDVNAGALVDRDRTSRSIRALQIAAGSAIAVLALGFVGSLVISGRLAERSSTLAELARQASDQGLYERAGRYATAGLEGADWPLVGFDARAAETELRRALLSSPTHATLVGHEDGVQSAAFSPDGTRIATSSLDNTVRIWDSASGRQLHVLRGHRNGVLSASFSPDGTLLLSLSADNTARLWNVRTGEEIQVLPVLEAGDIFATSAAFSPDGRRIVTTAQDWTPKLWDSSNGELLTSLNGHQLEVYDAAFSPDGTRVVTASADFTARIWDANSGAEIAALTGHTGTLYDVVFSPDGSRVVTASGDGTARLWDGLTGAPVAVLTGHADGVRDVSFSTDGQRLVTVSTGMRDPPRVWNAETARLISELRGHQGQVNQAIFGEDGNTVLTASADGTTRIWDAITGRQLRELSGHEAEVRSVQISPDWSRAVTASEDRTARIWSLAPNGPVEMAALRGHQSGAESAAFSPDGRLIVTASLDGSVRLWDAQSGTQTRRVRGHGRAYSGAFSPDGTRVAAAFEDGTARILDARDGREVLVLRGHVERSNVQSVDFSMDGARIVTASADGTVRIWNASNGQTELSLEVCTLSEMHGAVMSAAFSPDGKQVVTAGDCERPVRVWDVNSGNLVRELDAGNGGHTARSAAFSADGRRIIAVGRDGLPRIWESSNGRIVAMLRGHDNTFGVQNAAFSPDGRFVVTASADKSVRVWDAATGREILVIRGQGFFHSASFGPDGSRIVASSENGVVRVWQLPQLVFATAQELRQAACAGPLAGGGGQFTAEELREAPLLGDRMNACRPASLWSVLSSLN